MKTPADIIIELESDNSRLFKESILKREMEANNDEFFQGLSLALDNLVTFGVKQIPERISDYTSGTYTPEFMWNAFDKLAKRQVTGNAARDMIQGLMDKSTKHDWNNWYMRILLKDLKCGVDIKTINNVAKKVNPKYIIPVFSCQLAKDSKKHDKKLSGIKILNHKYDGSRILTILYPDGTVNQYSRNGKEVVNFPEIRNNFSTLKGHFLEPMVFDGEIMSASFQELMTQFYRKENVNTTDSVLYLFDLLPLKDFHKGICHKPQKDRIANLKLVPEFDNIKLVDNFYVNLDTEIGIQQYEGFYEKCLEAGLEGIMIKDPEAPYECKRSTAWLKRKPTVSFDMEIVGMEEGTGKYTGMLGALVCYSEEEGKEIQVSVGSGLTDEEREEYWENSDEVVGKIAEISCDCITQNQNGGYSLRFPRFIRLRGMEAGEKI